MDELGTLGTEKHTGGVILKPPRNRSRFWFLTINNPDDTDAQKIRGMKEKWVFQYERGEVKGTLHIQATLGFKNPVDFTKIKEWFPRAKIERAKQVEACVKYCSKSDTRVDGPWSQGFYIPPIRILRPWQKKIVDDLLVQNDRQLLWISDINGGIGKTFLAKYLVENYNAIYINGSAKDMKCAIASWANKDDLICIFGFPRSKDGMISYAGIEEIKDGLFFSSKYEPVMINMRSPRILILANFDPDKKEMSSDRWDIRYGVDLTDTNDNKGLEI